MVAHALSDNNSTCGVPFAYGHGVDPIASSNSG